MNTLARRASAEGYSAATIKAAIAAVQAEGEAAAETAGVYYFNEVVSLIEMAQQVAKSTYYTGGYSYPGTDFGAALRHYQPTMHSRVGESRDCADIDTVIDALRALPIGTEVIKYVNYGNGAESDYYLRTPTGFVHVLTDSEQDREFYRNQNYATPHLVAAKLGVVCSRTFLEVYEECLYF